MAQTLSLSYYNHIIIPEEFSGLDQLGGFSGITYETSTNKLLLCADKPPARLLKIATGSSLKMLDPEINLLKPILIRESELEGIVLDPLNNGYYVSDEQTKGTRILHIDSTGHFIKIILPKNAPFLPLSSYNSGIEGLTLSGDGSILYFAFERPTEPCYNKQITTIGSINLITNDVTLYAYQLHEVKDDELNTNGISEILWLSKDRLLVMERAYLPGKGNIVRLYDTSIENKLAYNGEAINCSDDSILPVLSELIFDFSAISELKIDNAEGMCFNADRSKMYLITDNNFSSKQETQLISLLAIWQ